MAGLPRGPACGPLARMPSDPSTHYEVLGVAKNAKAVDIGRAYNRLRAEMQQETAAPDPRRLLKIQAAYEVLSDETRREAYDASLRAPLKLPGGRRNAALVCAAGILLLGVIGYFAWPRTAGPRARDAREILAAAALAVGRVQAIDMAGNAKPHGLAFALREGALATSCQGLAPTTELVVLFAQRRVPARVADSGAGRAYCVLEATGVGSWPLAMGGALPKPGDTVYATTVNDAGEVALAQGKVRRVAVEAGATRIEVTAPASAEAAGGPLLDDQGRVVAIADGSGRHVALGP